MIFQDDGVLLKTKTMIRAQYRLKIGAINATVVQGHLTYSYHDFRA